MANLLLTNDNLENLIKSLRISEEQKTSLISSVSKLDKTERLELLDVLKDVYLMDLEETEALEKVKNTWQK